MVYVIHYNIAAALICTLVLVLFFTRSFFPLESNKYYVLLGFLIAVTSIFDVFCSLIFMGKIDYHPYIFSFVFAGYFIGATFSSLVYVLYIVSLLDQQITKDGRIIKIIVYILMAYSFLTFPFSQYTKMYFYMDETGYHHGTSMWVFYFSLIVSVIMIIYLLARYGKNLTRRQRYAAYFSLVAVISSSVFQIYYGNIPISNFANALTFVVVFQTLQNSREYSNAKLGLFDDTAFLMMVNNYIRQGKSFYVFSFDLEGISFVEQAMGIDTRNKLLSYFGTECKTSLQGMLFYMGNARFAYIFDSTRKDAVQKYAEWLTWRAMAPFEINGIRFSLIPRMAAAEYGDSITDRETLINSVRYALREAKVNSRTDVVWASEEMIESYKRYTDIVYILKTKLVENGFEVYYQPIFDKKSGKFSVAEALVRLKDDKLGFIPPDEFIPISEQNGLIIEIGEQVFRKVCMFLSNEGKNLGIDYIEVNLSMVQCMQEDLHKTLKKIMDEHGIPYSKIDFEITETYSSSDQTMLLKNMDALITAGSSFAMDDYGTGFANTDYLLKYPFKLVKLDKIFVWDAMKDDKAMKILKHTVSMIKSLNLGIVAEGVETKEQADMLLDMGCDYLQGYLYSKPVPKNEYVEFLKKNQE